MNKRVVWIIIIVLGFLTALGCFCLMLCLNPSFQKRMFLDALTGNGYKAQVKAVEIGFSKGRVSELSLADSAVSVVVDEALFEYSLLDWLLGDTFAFDSVAVAGLHIKMTSTDEGFSDASEKKPVSEKQLLSERWRQFKQMGLPVAFQALDVEGHLDFDEMLWSFAMKGNDLRAGANGEISADAQLVEEGSLESESAPMRSLTLEVDCSFNDLGFPATIDAVLVSKYRGETCRATLQFQSMEAEDRFSLDFAPVDGSERDWLQSQWLYRVEEGKLSGDLNIEAPEDALRMCGLPSGAVAHVQGRSKVNWMIDTNVFELEGSLSAGLPSPLQSEPGASGALWQLESAFQVKGDGERVLLEHLQSDLYDASERLLELHLDRSLLLPIGEGFSIKNLPNERLAMLRLNLPLPILQAIYPALGWDAGILEGQFALSGHPLHGFVFESEQPWHFRNVSISSGGQPMIQNVHIDFKPKAYYRVPEVRLELEAIKSHVDGVPLGQGALTAVASLSHNTLKAIKLEGGGSLQIHEIMKQAFVKAIIGGQDPLGNQPLTQQIGGRLVYDPENGVRVEKLLSKLSQSGGEPVFYAEVLQPFSLDRVSGRYHMQSASGPVLDCRFNDFSLPFLNLWMSDWRFDSGDLSGRLRVSNESGRVSAITTAPLSFNELSVSRFGIPKLESIDVLLDAEIAQASDTLYLKFSQLGVTDAGHELFGGSFDMQYDFSKQQLDAVSASVNGDLSGILKQPMLRAWDNLREGDFALRVRAAPTRDARISAEVELTGLQLKSTGERMVKARMKYDGKVEYDPLLIEMKGPIWIDGKADTSDCEVYVRYDSGSVDRKLRLNMNGTSLDVSDLQLLASAFEPQSAEPIPVGTTKEALVIRADVDRYPFWIDQVGSIQVKLDRLRYRNILFQALDAEVLISPNRLEIKDFSVNTYDAPVHVNGGIDFLEGRADTPYEFKGKIDIKNFPIGQAFGIEEWIKGRFNLSADAASSAANIDQILHRIRGQLEVDSQKGELYFFQKGATPMSAVGGLLSSTETLLGELTGIQFGSDFSFVNKLTSFLQKISFYHFDLKAHRGDDLNLIFDAITVNGELASLNGQGRIQYQENLPLIEQDMNFKIDLSAKDWVADALNKLSLLKSDQQQGEYVQAYSFPVSGSLSEPNFKIIGPITQSLKRFLGSGANSRNSGSEPQKPDPASLIEEAAGGLLKGLF